jgi:hypothetical protein
MPNEVRTSTVVKNVHQASRQNLMIISGEGNQSQMEKPIGEYDQITQAFIMNQLQGSQGMNKSPLGSIPQKKTLSPKRLHS